MGNQNRRLYLGVDGGGTKTVTWLGQQNDGILKVVGRGAAGPGNPRSTDFQTAMLNIESAVLAAFSDADLAKSRVSTACFCLAGAGRAEEQNRVAEWMKGQELASNISVTSDAEAIMAAAASRPNQGELATVALIAGTGSMALAKAADGRRVRCGGWGYLIDDCGSGYWLGQQVLRLACQTADGRSSETEVLDAVLRATACPSAAELVDWTYDRQSNSQRRNIALLAPIVFEFAKWSPAAAGIANLGAQHLAELVQTAVQKLEDQEYSLAFAGGVFCNQATYASRVQQQLSEAGCKPQQAHLVEHPVLGALHMAVAQEGDS